VTLKQLRALREVAETRNFTAAAKRLHTTQSVLSVNIAQLEQTVGVKLIDRSTRRFALTQAGIEFLPAAVRILADLDASIKNLSTLAALQRGTVFLGCPASIASALLAKPLASFQAAHPLIRVILRDAPIAQLLAKLRAGEVEMVIGSLSRPESDLALAPFIKDQLAAVVRIDSPLAGRTHISWRALGSQQIVAPSEESALRVLIERTFTQATAKPFKPVFEATHWITIMAMVEAGLGVAITPRYALRYLPRAGVTAIDIVQPVVGRHLSVIRHRERMLSPAAAAFVAHLQKESRRERS
jgi:DNA-binding transcriptional LysR family regulator